MNLDQLITCFKSIIETKQYPKNQIIHRSQTICHYLYFVQSGVVRAFYYQDGKDVTAHIAIDQGAITAIDSFIQRSPSKYTIELLEDSTLMRISRSDLDRFLHENPQNERAVRLFLEAAYIDLAERIEDMLFHSAQERYERLIEQNPTVIQRVSLGHIASYLGITQETLSRVRARSRF